MSFNYYKKEFNKILSRALQSGATAIDFFMKEKSEWGASNTYVYKYLYQNGHIGHPELLLFFEQMYLSSVPSSKVISVMTCILGDILLKSSDTKLKRFAKRLLMEKSQPCVERYTLDYLKRLSALQQLSCVPHSEVDDLYELIIKEDKKYEMKIAALLQKEDLNDTVTALKADAIKAEFEKFFAKEHLSKADLYKIEYVMWFDPEASYMAWQSFEMVKLDELLQLFKKSVEEDGLYAGIKKAHGFTPLSRLSSTISYSAPLYSILLFIGSYTTNIESFKKIQETVLPLVQSVERSQGSIGLLAGSEEFVETLSNNPVIDATVLKWSGSYETALRPRPDSNDEWLYRTNFMKQSFLNILSDNSDQQKQIVAMRYLAAFYGHNHAIIERLFAECISESDEVLAREASKLVDWIAPDRHERCYSVSPI